MRHGFLKNTYPECFLLFIHDNALAEKHMELLLYSYE